MVTTITLNPCIDHTIFLDKISCGALNKISSSQKDLGGKGINVSMALNNLGIKNCAMTFEFSDSIQREFFKKNNLKSILIKTSGELRTNIKIFETEARAMTELNEAGGEISKATLDELESKILESESEIFVFGGSLCPGIPEDFYKSIIKKLSAKNPEIKIILDASGIPFKEGIKARPFLVKPNLFELETEIGKSLKTKDEIIRAAEGIISRGVNLVCVSMGKDGAMIVSKSENHFIPAPKVKVESAQGAGDALVAGLVFGILKNYPIKQILKAGVAASGAAISHKGTVMGTKEEFEKIFDKK